MTVRPLVSFSGFALGCLLFVSCASRKPARASSVSDKEVSRWFDKKEWAGGLTIVPFADIDKREFYVQYHKHPQWWDKTFAYMRDHDLAKLANGKTQIEGDSVYVSVTEAPDKDFDKTAWESHRKYIDLQYVAAGKERILMSTPASLSVIKPYEETRDAVNYSGEPVQTYVAVPGTFYLFFPMNAHRPSIKVDDAVVKKVTFKIRYSK